MVKKGQLTNMTPVSENVAYNLYSNWFSVEYGADMDELGSQDTSWYGWDWSMPEDENGRTALFEITDPKRGYQAGERS